MSSHLQGNGGRSCLLLWNAKNVASPKYGPWHTHNAKWTTKRTGMLLHSVYSWLQNLNRSITTHSYTNGTASVRPVCSECTLIWQQPRLTCNQETQPVNFEAMYRTMGSVQAPLGTFLGIGVSFRTSGWLFLVCLFSFSLKKKIEIYAQVCKCDWTEIELGSHKMKNTSVISKIKYSTHLARHFNV